MAARKRMVAEMLKHNAGASPDAGAAIKLDTGADPRREAIPPVDVGYTRRPDCGE